MPAPTASRTTGIWLDISALGSGDHRIRRVVVGQRRDGSTFHRAIGGRDEVADRRFFTGFVAT